MSGIVRPLVCTPTEVCCSEGSSRPFPSPGGKRVPADVVPGSGEPAGWCRRTRSFAPVTGPGVGQLGALGCAFSTRACPGKVETGFPKRTCDNKEISREKAAPAFALARTDEGAAPNPSPNVVAALPSRPLPQGERAHLGVTRAR